jgi:hypothetical protein
VNLIGFGESLFAKWAGPHVLSQIF